ncbi:hypothetical protein HBDW_32770 [Herbaspirillum sp. DW155]|uniref:hypothetical protein n=1 Tax=Herbaspirillum sp. DW155 TaxID=3095609 RepID=UPI0030927E2B|nr:hypothetical protein HBDW_32770 [Herbaspirillum sp. DW155]
MILQGFFPTLQGGAGGRTGSFSAAWRALIPATCPDIHIFWEQACGEALGKSAKSLIPKDFPAARGQEAKNGQASLAGRRVMVRDDIHIFWWQACGEALDKPFKPLISNNFSITQQAHAKSCKTTPRGRFCIAATRQKRLPIRFCEDIHTFWWQACGQGLSNRLKHLITKDIFAPMQTRAGLRQFRASGAKPRPDWPGGIISTFFGGKPVDKRWTSNSNH